MNINKFNSATAKSLYTYRHNPVHPHSFMILKKNDQDEYEPVGEYTVLDKDEETALSEKKVMNLISLMNGKDGSLLNIGEGTGQRTLFQPIPRKNPDEKSKIMFYTWAGHHTETKKDDLTELEIQRIVSKGISKENAMLTIAEDLEDDREIKHH